MVYYEAGIFIFRRFRREKVIAGFTTRRFAGRDLQEDMRVIFRSLGENYKEIKFVQQVHGSSIVWSNEISSACAPEADGLMSAAPQQVLAVRTADCLPLFFFERQRRITALVHLGWRPAYAGILTRFQALLASSGAAPEHLLAAFGPGLRSCCFEVGGEFLSYAPFRPYLRMQGGRLRLDLAGYAKERLISMGVKPSCIIDSDFCSFCRQDMFYSYRGGRTQKRTLSFIMLVQ